MQVRDFSSKMKQKNMQIGDFGSKMQQIARKTAPDWKKTSKQKQNKNL